MSGLGLWHLPLSLQEQIVPSGRLLRPLVLCSEATSRPLSRCMVPCALSDQHNGGTVLPEGGLWRAVLPMLREIMTRGQVGLLAAVQEGFGKSLQLWPETMSDCEGPTSHWMSSLLAPPGPGPAARGPVGSPVRRRFSSAPRSSAGFSAWFPVRSVEGTLRPGPGAGAVVSDGTGS